MNRILITGGSGFLGRHLGIKLKNKKNKILLASRNNFQNALASEITGLDVAPLDITNIEAVRDLFSIFKPDTVIHAAASKYVDLSEKFPFECIDVNVLGSSNLARVAIDNKVKNVIGISTDKTAPPVDNTYGISKALMERLFCSINSNKTKFACVRFGNIAWSTGSVFPIWQKMMKEKTIISSTGPHMRRFFFSINEATNLVSDAIDNINKINGKILTLKMKSAQISDILNIWCKIYNTSWKQIKERPGDKIDEFLIGENELQHTYEIKLSKKIHYIIDFNNHYKNKLISPISTFNSERLTKKEIISLIQQDLKN